MFSESARDHISVELSGGEIVRIETGAPTGREDVVFDRKSFSDLSQSIRGIALEMRDSFDAVGASKATVRFGVEASIESGILTAAVVKNSKEANFEITLEWESLDSDNLPRAQ